MHFPLFSFRFRCKERTCSTFFFKFYQCAYLSFCIIQAACSKIKEGNIPLAYKIHF